MFCNLGQVTSSTENLHRQFVAALPVTRKKEDPSNKLLDMDVQIAWLREIGFADVDCHWKWRELALLAGIKTGRLSLSPPRLSRSPGYRSCTGPAAR